MKELLQIVYDEEARKYYVIRKDCPGEELHEITLGGYVDLEKNLQRYQNDAWNEKNRQ
jgi:hypothetical protein